MHITICRLFRCGLHQYVTKEHILQSAVTVKPFKSIPGPKPWPLVGNSLLFSPLGPYSVKDLMKAFTSLHQQYGDIVSLKMGAQNMILVFTPDSVQTIFQHEGKFPERPTFEALKKIRKQEYGAVGLVPGDGEEWYRWRQNVASLLKLKTVHSYWSKQQVVAKDFANSLVSKTNPDGIIENFLPHSFLYALEAIGIICYGKRLNCLTTESPEGRDIAEANTIFLEALGVTLHQPPLWKLWKTDVYKKLESTQKFMMQVSSKHLASAKQKLEADRDSFAENDPILFQLLTNKELSETEMNLLVSELFQGGIDATATVISMMLYDLAKNAHVQDSIFVDLTASETQPGKFPPLLRACLKETLRLHPTAAANSRIIHSDAVFSGYNVPSGTLVVGVSPVISRMDRYFQDPRKFHPWRWLTKDGSIHPYGVLPFGHGARMCPGRRVAEQEILLCVSEILLKYKVFSFNVNEIEMVTSLNLIPSEPLNFGLIVR